MSKTITDLTLQLGQANAKLAEAQSSIARLTSKLPKLGLDPTALPQSLLDPSI